jgi:hypothetical protein
MSYTDNILKEDGWFTGEDKVLIITIYDPTATQPAIEAGVAATQEITGWALSYMLKRNRTDADSEAVLSRSTVSGISIISPEVEVAVAAALTENLAEGIYYHELKRTDTGIESVLMDGEVHLRRAVHNT